MKTPPAKKKLPYRTKLWLTRGPAVLPPLEMEFRSGWVSIT